LELDFLDAKELVPLRLVTETVGESCIGFLSGKKEVDHLGITDLDQRPNGHCGSVARRSGLDASETVLDVRTTGSQRRRRTDRLFGSNVMPEL